MAHILLNTFGSFGDLHPYMALGLALQRRGHEATIGSCGVYREKVESEGLRFVPVRPDVEELLERPEWMAKVWDPARGTDFLLRDYLMPRVREAFEDLLPAAERAELLLTHPVAYAGPVAAQHLRKPWLSVALQPGAMFSLRDSMVIPAAPWLRHLYGLGAWFTGSLLRLGDRRTRAWARPIEELRKDLGLPRNEQSPAMRGQYSPHGTLALFSRHFAPPQPDWPANVCQTGFVFYDHAGAGLEYSGEDRETQLRLDEFLANGSAPVLFTLGSSAVMQAGDFYEESMKAARRLGMRAILLTGRPVESGVDDQKDLFVTDYLRFSEVMPRVAVVVHQGGIGTTAQTLRAGCPALVVPWAHDQPDNGYRLERLGVARVLSRKRYCGASAAEELRQIINDPAMRERAQNIGQAIRAEGGVATACEFIEAFLQKSV